MGSPLRQALDAAVASIRARLGAAIEPPRVALVLGSGLGDFAERLQEARAVRYSDVEGLPASTVPGHEGRFVFGRLAGLPIVALQGRVHTYEGHSAEEAVRGLRAVLLLGARTVVLTNAAGALDPSFAPGEIVLVDDHISLAALSPLRGSNDESLGPRFPDMTEAYDRALKALVERVAQGQGAAIRRGVYAFVPGPSYETPAEVRMLRALGADLVGMSTVPETVAAVHMGARVVALSLVTNWAAGIARAPLSHTEVQEVAHGARERFGALIEALLGEMARDASGPMAPR